MTHFTWSVEKQDGKCSDCGTQSVLVYPCGSWLMDSETPADVQEDFCGEVDVSEEVSGHWCPSCRKLVSLSLNTQ